MSAQFVMQDDVIRRNHAMRNGLHDHLIRTAEARRLQAEAIAKAVHWLWSPKAERRDRPPRATRVTDEGRGRP